MEVIDVPEHPGMFEVLFNGESQTCFDDFDCPGAGICAINQSWQVDPSQGMCMCNTYYGFSGLNCDQWTEQTGAIFVIVLISAVLAAIASLVGAYLIVRYVFYRVELARVQQEINKYAVMAAHRDHPRSRFSGRPRTGSASTVLRKMDPVLITLVLCFLAAVSGVVAGLFNLIGACWFPNVATLQYEGGDPNHRIRRIPLALDDANYVSMALGICLSICGALLLPLTWIDMSNELKSILELTQPKPKQQLTIASMRLKESNVTLVIVVSLFLTALTLGLQLPFQLFYTQTTDPGMRRMWRVASAIGWLCIVAPLLVVNVVAFIKVSSFVSKWRMPSDDNLIRRLVRRIQITAILVTLCLAVILVCFGICPIVFSTRGYYTDPRVYIDNPENAVRVGRTTVPVMRLVLLWFLALPVSNCGEALRQRKLRLASITASSVKSSFKSIPGTSAVHPLIDEGLVQTDVGDSESISRLIS